MFIDAVGMPAEFEHLKTRLRIEQARCLFWGEQVGLAETLLDAPSRLLQLNSNLVLDVLQEVQTSFRSSCRVVAKYDSSLALLDRGSDACPKSMNSAFLQKTLAIWEKGGRTATKIEWSMIGRAGFERLVTRLIQYNDRMESMLDREALETVRSQQAQSNLMLLQVTNQVSQIHALIQALHLSSTVVSEDMGEALKQSLNGENHDLVSLAVFKSHHIKIELDFSGGEKLEIATSHIRYEGAPTYSGRQFAALHGREVWLEWRENVDEALSQEEYRHTVENRVQRLAAILAAPDRPKAFRSPRCLGYCRDQQSSMPRYALVYGWPPDINDREVDFMSLRELLTSQWPPSLNTKVKIAQTLAASLLYLHAVDWLHKDIQSDNILFAADDEGPLSLKEPLLSGFEYARPAIPDAITVGHQFTPQHDLYRHPDLLRINAGRSKRIHDIYSLGLVLAELALWKPIERIAGIEVRRSHLLLLQDRLLDEKRGVFVQIAERAGWVYADVVRACIEGTVRFGLAADEDDERPEVAARLSNAMYQTVVQRLQSIKV